jgi:hypothetical protein
MTCLKLFSELVTSVSLQRPAFSDFVAGLYNVAPFSATMMSNSSGQGNTSNKLANVRPVKRITCLPEARNLRNVSMVDSFVCQSSIVVRRKGREAHAGLTLPLD